MAEISQKRGAPIAAMPRPGVGGAALSGGWLAGAARALGFGSSAETGAAGRGFDFTAMHRSLSSLEQKPPTGK